MKAFFSALQFLTILPLPASLFSFQANDAKGLKKSITFFPLVGLLIGCLAASLDHFLNTLFPSNLTDIFTVTFLIIISGGVHMDGLADTADGFFSSRSKEKILTIMKDSVSGPMAIITLVLVILTKVVLLSSLEGSLRFQTLLFMPLAGRSALPVVMGLFPYARPKKGLGKIFQSCSPLQSLWASVFLLGAGWMIQGWLGLIIAIFSLAFTFFFTAYAYQKIQGYTGDTLGATCELTELVPLLVLSLGEGGGL